MVPCWVEIDQKTGRVQDEQGLSKLDVDPKVKLFGLTMIFSRLAEQK